MSTSAAKESLRWLLPNLSPIMLPKTPLCSFRLRSGSSGANKRGLSHRASQYGQGNELVSDCRCVCYLNAYVMMFTDEGPCTPIQNNYLLLGLEVNIQNNYLLLGLEVNIQNNYLLLGLEVNIKYTEQLPTTRARGKYTEQLPTTGERGKHKIYRTTTCYWGTR